MTNIKMTSQKPYLIPAIYEWILDNNCTPYIVVDPTYAGVRVPKHLQKDEPIIFNIAPSATHGMHYENDALVFNARFNGLPYNVYIPLGAINNVFAKETGEGLMFSWETSPTPPDEPNTPTDHPTPGTPPKKPALRLVK